MYCSGKYAGARPNGTRASGAGQAESGSCAAGPPLAPRYSRKVMTAIATAAHSRTLISSGQSVSSASVGSPPDWR